MGKVAQDLSQLIGTPENIISRYLRNNGTKNAIGDYSNDPLILFAAVPAKKVFRISHLIVKIAEKGKMYPGYYGASEALTKGIKVRIVNGSRTIINLTNGRPVKTNYDWGTYCDLDITDESSGFINYLYAKWCFLDCGQPIPIKAAQRLEVVLNDDFTNLLEHTFFVNGYIE